MERLRTGILVHGCHVEAREWERIIWGEPQTNLLGRMPKGILTAIEEDAELMVVGTGASERDGVKEAGCMVRHMFDHFQELGEFEAFRGVDLGRLEEAVQDMVVTETSSQNTREEVQSAGRIFLERGIERVILVSSPTHIARCMQDAMIAFEGDPKFSVLRRRLLASPSDTCFADSGPGDVVVVEPPHRGDRPAFPVHKFVRRLFKVAPDRLESFLFKFGDLLQEFGA